MYSAEITSRFIEEQRKATPTFRAEYHSIDTVQGMIDLLDEAWDPETKQQTRNLTADELVWIENEHLLCTHDFSYWASHYAWINNWEKKLTRFDPNIAQKVVLDIWAEMEEKRWAIMMAQLKARQVGMCLHPHTKILTSDLRWVAIESMTVGQAILGVEEYPRLGRGASRKMCVGAVEGIADVYEPAYEMMLDNGGRLIATGLHRFLAQHRGGAHTEWREVRQTRPGDKIRWICRPWGQPSYADGWIAGMMDGEGSLRSKNRAGVELCIAQVLGPVHERIKAYMVDNGYPYREDFDRREKGSRSKFGSKVVAKVVLGRQNNIMELVGKTRPTRFLRTDWWEGKELTGKKVGHGWATVVSITPVGTMRMIDLQTSTKTFIAEGFVSHNSTLTELAVAHRVQFYPDVDAVVASSTPNKTDKMAKMIRTVWERTPWWLMPRTTAVYNLMPREFGGHNSALDVTQSGNQFSGVARGSTPNVFHASELAEWTNPGEDIDASLLNAIHETPWVFVVLESTALGRDNWWHRKWLLSKEGWERGRARLCPIFLPWYVGTDIYPDSGWLIKHPVPDGWQPDESIQHHARRAEEYVQAHPRIKKFLGPHWVMPIEQMWWYDVTRDEYRKASELNRFLSEMPADDFEAFQSTNHSAFDTEVIITLREKTQNPAGVYKLMGVGDHREDIPPDKRPMASEVDHTLPIIPIDCRWGMHEAHYQLVPVVFEGYDQRTDGKIFIWEHPRDGFEYGLGIDTGDGIGLDGSVVEGLRKGTLTHNDKQICEMTSSYINAYQFWPWAYALGSYYSRPVNGSVKQARACIDVQRNGESVQLELRKRGWANFHQWMRLDNKKLRMDRAVKLGFIANQWSRPMMLDQLLTYINNGWLEIESPMFIQEMESFERDDQVQSMKAAFGAHDDRIMALGMILFSFHVLELRGVQASVASQRNQLSAADDPEWDPGYQGRDIPLEFARSRVLEQAQRLGGGPRPGRRM